jgi:hypothetical protein
MNIFEKRRKMEELFKYTTTYYMENVGVDLKKLGMVRSVELDQFKRFNEIRNKGKENRIKTYLKRKLRNPERIHMKIICIDKWENVETKICCVHLSYEVRGELTLRPTLPFEKYYSPFGDRDDDIDKWFEETYEKIEGITGIKLEEPIIEEDTGLYMITIKSSNIPYELRKEIDLIYN